MNTKVNKIVKLAAAGLFLLALAINIKVTLDDPFSMISEQAIASDSSSSEDIITMSRTFPICEGYPTRQGKEIDFSSSRFVRTIDLPNIASNETVFGSSITFNGAVGYMVYEFIWGTQYQTKRICAEGLGLCITDDLDCKYRS